MTQPPQQPSRTNIPLFNRLKLWLAQLVLVVALYACSANVYRLLSFASGWAITSCDPRDQNVNTEKDKMADAEKQRTLMSGQRKAERAAFMKEYNKMDKVKQDGLVEFLKSEGIDLKLQQ
jgi:hypothetical protein